MPVHWKHIIFAESKVDIYSYNCKETYAELLQRILCLPEQYVVRWEEILETEIDEIDWYNSYIDCLTWTISAKLRSFYYQLRVGDIMTNSRLVKMKLKDNANCAWCPCIKQTILHLFWEFKVVKEIWDTISIWLSGCLNNNIEIKKALIFLYNIEAGNYTRIINLIVLIVSRVLYVCKCLDVTPTFLGVLKKISEIEYIERTISKKNNQLYKHNKSGDR